MNCLLLSFAHVPFLLVACSYGGVVPYMVSEAIQNFTTRYYNLCITYETKSISLCFGDVEFQDQEINTNV